jgi:hypothetical protein
VKEGEADGRWPLQCIPALRAIRTFHVQQRIADRKTAPPRNFLAADRRPWSYALEAHSPIPYPLSPIPFSSPS